MFSLKAIFIAAVVFLSTVYLGTIKAGATDLTIGASGRVTVELITSNALFSNTMSLASPTATIAQRGCKLQPSDGLEGQPLLSAKLSQHGCRVELDADPATPGIQPFTAGTTFRFGLCAQTNGDPPCEYVWSSSPSLNSDGFDHLHIKPLHSAEFPGQIFQLNWEDQSNLGDRDFDDLIAIVRVNMDTDGDGLWDDWERFGIDTDGDGIIDLNLPALGANYLHKDIFLEIDFMDCAAGGDCTPGNMHSHRPKIAAINAVIQAFADAPFENLDGIPGINLHVDTSNAIPHQNFLNIDGLCFPGGPDIGSFDAVKADPANFGPTNPRRFAYHYALFTHSQGRDREGRAYTYSGCGELPGNDFQVSLGGWNIGAGDLDGDGLPDADVGTVSQQAGTLMHELGHTLNLRHGGGDHANYKPNYLSVMNYWFQTSGIPPTDPDGPGPLVGRIDYSRTALPTLVETDLNETVGIGDGTDNTRHFCPNGNPVIGSGTGPIDWNCNGIATETGVSSDINGDRGVPVIIPGLNMILDTTPLGDDVIIRISGFDFIFEGPNRKCDTTASGDDIQIRPVGDMAGFNDWANLKFDFQNSGDFDDGEHNFSEKVVELDYDTYKRTLAPDLRITKTASANSVVTGSGLTYTIKVTNDGPDTATGVVVADNLPVATTIVACEATDGGECRSTVNNQMITFPAIRAGQTVTVILKLMVNCSVADGTVIGNPSTVTSMTPDRNTANNTAIAPIVIASNPRPVIATIANITAVTTQPGDTGVVVNYPAPAVTDNCSDVTLSFSKPSGSVFPAGVTTVIVTATDSGGGATTTSFTVTIWDIAIQDEASGDTLFFDSFSGHYEFRRCGKAGFTFTGRGVITRTGCLVRLNDGPRVTATLDRCVIAPHNRGTASIRPVLIGTTFNLTDNNVISRTAICQ